MDHANYRSRHFRKVCLGHQDVSLTARHDARWVADEYRNPIEVKPGEVPPDLLARLETRHATGRHKASEAPGPRRETLSISKGSTGGP